MCAVECLRKLDLRELLEREEKRCTEGGAHYNSNELDILQIFFSASEISSGLFYKSFKDILSIHLLAIVVFNSN